MNDSNVHKSARWPFVAGAVVVAIVTSFAICESLGWPFLAAPMQRWLGESLQRRVTLGAEPNSAPKAKVNLLGGVSVAAAHIEIGAPAWSKQPHMVSARDAEVQVAYVDLWRASQGKPLHIRSLRARELDARLERLEDGRFSWQLTTKPDPDKAADAGPLIPTFGRLLVEDGTATYQDALVVADVTARFSLSDGSAAAGTAPVLSAPSAAASASVPAAPGLRLQATGSYQKNRLEVKLETASVLSALGADAKNTALPVFLDAKVGRATMTFRGTATDALQLTELRGRFTVQGPSLASVGDPLKVTLPTTGPFQTDGMIAKDGRVWNAVIERATIGSSRLSGAFQYDPRSKVPVLSGRLSGAKLLLADLGPTVGTVAQVTSPATSPAAASTPAVPAKDKRLAAKETDAKGKATGGKQGRVLPDREFDLPSLRAMNANVLVAIDNLDFGTSVLDPLKPLRAHLVLTDGVLSLRDVDARTGQGRLSGMLQLDGRQPVAVWNADMRWDGIRLESWINQTRAGDAPPYITGRLSGQARVTGQGKSTAAILGSLRGGVRLRLADGTVSHLAVEAAGLDLAEGVGLLFKGDDALRLQCTVADFNAEQGVLRPRAFVIDTEDSVVLVDGSLSLASEAMDLKITTLPKDFSPFALRTPVLLRGTFTDPSVSLDTSRLAPRIGVAAVLALLNPIAALLPMLDFGDSDEAKKGAQACRMLSSRITARPALPAPPAKRSAAGA